MLCTSGFKDDVIFTGFDGKQLSMALRDAFNYYEHLSLVAVGIVVRGETNLAVLRSIFARND